MNVSGVVVLGVDVHIKIGNGDGARRIFWPFGQFEPRCCKQLAKTRIFPFAGIGEAVKIEVPDRQVAGLVGFDHGVGWAFDAALHAQCAQQVAHERGFASAQVAMQRHEAVADAGAGGQPLGKGLGVGFALPAKRRNRSGSRWFRFASYNGRVPSSITHDLHLAAQPEIDPNQLLYQVALWAKELGFSQIGVAAIDLSDAEAGLQAWLAQGFHGEMAYMAAHGLKRARPAELVPGTVSVISVRMNYLPDSDALAGAGEGNAPQADWRQHEWQRLSAPGEGVISLYARGRDYHKVMRSRLQRLQQRMAERLGPFGHRVFCDSAPVLEAELGTRAGLGWRGKHTLVLSREAGSMFFLGELFVDLALPASAAQSAHCGQCSACIEACPTQAIVAPYQVDARRCISYLTIEYGGSIAPEIRPLIGNRIYGCDDCQLACPWNKFAQRATLPDFDARPHQQGGELAGLMRWTEAEFLSRTEGSAIRRIGHARWLRNVALAIGNAAHQPGTVAQRDAMQSALALWAAHPDPVVSEQVNWSQAQLAQAVG